MALELAKERDICRAHLILDVEGTPAELAGADDSLPDRFEYLVEPVLRIGEAGDPADAGAVKTDLDREPGGMIGAWCCEAHIANVGLDRIDREIALRNRCRVRVVCAKKATIEFNGVSMTYENAYASGVPFSEFVRDARANRTQWESFARRAPLIAEAAAPLAELKSCLRLLVLADDWCGDAVNTLPVIARMVESAENVELRVVPRDAFPVVRDRHLTNGSQSIPIVILIDEQGEALGAWGPRPAVLQELFERDLRALSKEARYLEIRRWYARDRGVSTAMEISTLIGLGVAAAPSVGGRSCAEVGAG
jgi:hypothetical protein